MAAIDYVTRLAGRILRHDEKELLLHMQRTASLHIKGFKIYGNQQENSQQYPFLLDGIHQYDTGMVLDKMGIAVRTGTHCAQPVMDRYGIRWNCEGINVLL